MNMTKYDEQELVLLKYTELKKMCKQNDLKSSGRKVDLIKLLTSIPASPTTEYNESDISLYLADHTSPENQFRADLSDISEIKQRDVCGSSPDNASYDSLASKINSLKLQSTSIDSINEKKDENTLLFIENEEQYLNKMSKDVHKKEDLLEVLLNKFAEPAKAISDLIESNKVALENSRFTAQNFLQTILTEKLLEQESSLKNLHNEEVEKLKTEKSSSENILKKQITCLKNEKLDNLQHMKKLKEENESMSNNIEMASSEKSLLESKMIELNNALKIKDDELNKQGELMQAIEHNVKQNVLEVIKDEFNCSICQELFITAVTLPCSHSFCEMCLMQWFKTKKTCPVCRHELKMKVFFSKVLDNVVESIIDKSDSDEKHKHTILLRERNEYKRRSETETGHQGIKNMFFRVGDIIGNNVLSGNPSVGGSNNQSAAVANFNNRRRSRSQSPSTAHQRVATASNNVNPNSTSSNSHYNRFTYRIRCYNCGENHHVRNCPSRFL